MPDPNEISAGPDPAPAPAGLPPPPPPGKNWRKNAAVGGGVFVALLAGGFLLTSRHRHAAKAPAPQAEKPRAPTPQASVPPKMISPAAGAQKPAAPTDAARKAIEARYALGAQALMAQDLKGFLSLKTPNFQCIQPGMKTAAASPSVASTTLAAFAISTVTIQGDKIVVENVEKIVQNLTASKRGQGSMSSEISRRDTWIQADGVWKLSQTERLSFRKSEPAKGKALKSSPTETGAGLSDAELLGASAPDDKIADDCTNEIGILCYAFRDNIKAAKKCLKKYEGTWLSACRKSMGGPSLGSPP